MKSNSFTSGLLVAILAYVLAVAANVALLIFVGTLDLASALRLSAWIMGFIWLPTALLAGWICKNKGIGRTLWFVVAALLVSLLIVGGQSSLIGINACGF